MARVRDVELMSGFDFFPSPPGGSQSQYNIIKLRTKLALDLWPVTTASSQ